ncbi:hypothetical protein [Aquimarina celericrescens]|uniref:Uncharacterized protein n=1 Tax=Aquimarina celericrescens TaxID=1964542 RepID=A0ABW5ARM5_9FLAO|nr:hypothetical protein [Aquimarina celericrescens]
MKKLLLLLMVSATYIHCLAQESWDIITLQNGSVIVGKITEFNFNENLTVQTKDGYGFMFRTQDVRSIKKEQNSRKLTQDEQFKMVMPENNMANRKRYNANSSNTTPYNNYTSGSNLNPNIGNTNTAPSNNTQNSYSPAPVTQFQQGYQPIPQNYNQNYYSERNNEIPQNNSQNTTPQYLRNQDANMHSVNRAGALQQNNRYTGSNQNLQQPLENYNGSFTNNPGQYNQQIEVPTNYTNSNLTRNQENVPLNTRPLNSDGFANQSNAMSLNPVTKNKTAANPDIFTDINTLGRSNTTSKVNCLEGYGDFCFVNNTNKNVLVTLQKKQKDGYYGDYKEIAVKANSRGYFKSIKLGEYPFFVKIKNSVNDQVNYVILGRGNIKAQQCKTEYITINY